MNKILCTSQNTEAKTLPADVCIFDRFGQLSPAAVRSADCRFDSGVKWWIYVLSIVIYLCKNSFLFCWNSCKQHSKSLTHCCFWLTVSKDSINFQCSFFIKKCSCKMMNILPSDIFSFSAIPCSFNLQSDKTSLWSLLVFSRTTAKFGAPECSSHLCLYNCV